ncbi:MAG TPA: molybdate ABC transporter substrate-binding protein [Clostridia bacterium]|nr:molybdate ABC transporter substrate-binding protein [Clostridia bacterium]
MKRAFSIIVLFLSILFLSGCTQNIKDTGSKDITVCAAASLREALEELKPGFEQSRNIKLSFNFASSGTLQKQIEEGAPADLFISAGRKQMDALEDKGLIDKAGRRDLLKNRLVLVAAKEYKDIIKTAAELISPDAKISIGEPETVPAGQYAKESLTNLSLWDKLSGKLVFAKDVKQVLAYVESGEAAAGIVYASDATVLKDSCAVQTFEESTHSPIVYPAAVVSASRDKASAESFFDYLMSDEAQQVFGKYGFTAISR